MPRRRRRRAILQAAIDLGRSWTGLRQINLSASAEQTPAIRLYERVGFVAWGTEPKMLCVDGTYYDEVYMQLRLD